MTLPFPDDASQIARRRLASHHLDGRGFDEPAEVVRWLGMVQAQDYLAALWAVGVRLREASEASVEQALAERQIIRTWPARGTLHLAAAEDARWLLALLVPRNRPRAAGRHRQLGLEEADFTRARDLFAAALQGGKQLSRAAMYQVLETGGIATAGQRGIHILARLSEEAFLCFGVREGKQQRFTLLDEWLPPTPAKSRDEALAELARRFFTSHGPAALPDFAWWSGLTMAEAREGVALARPPLLTELIDGKSYWFSPSAPLPAELPPPVLLPAFDEYLVGYRDRDAVLEHGFVKQYNAGGGMLNPTIVIDGRVAGVWKRTIQKKAVVVTPAWFARPDATQREAFFRAAQMYGAFLGFPVVHAMP